MKSYLPADKQYLITRNGVIPLFLSLASLDLDEEPWVSIHIIVRDGFCT